MGHYRRIKDEIISDVLQWTPSHGRVSVCRRTRTYLQQPGADTRWNLEDKPGAMNDGDVWGETEAESHGNPCWRHDLMIICIYLSSYFSAYCWFFISLYICICIYVYLSVCMYVCFSLSLSLPPPLSLSLWKRASLFRPNIFLQTL